MKKLFIAVAAIASLAETNVLFGLEACSDSLPEGEATAAEYITGKDDAAIETRFIRFYPQNAISCVKAEDIKEYLSDHYQIGWPEGTGVRVVEGKGLWMTHQIDTILQIQGYIWHDFYHNMQAEIRVRFIDADRDVLASCGWDEVDGVDDPKELLRKLIANPKATLVADTQCVTSFGEETVVRSVSEYIYPTDYDVINNVESSQTTTSATNKVICSSKTFANAGVAIIEPDAFTMREVGSIVDVTPILDDAGEIISLDLRAILVENPDWKDYGSTIPSDRARSEYKLPMEEPFFPLTQVDAKLNMKPGTTIVTSAPVVEPQNVRTGKTRLCFVTAHMIGCDGRVIKPEAK